MDSVERFGSRSSSQESTAATPVRNADADASALLGKPGVCHRCEEYADDRMTVAMVLSNSGPGWSRYACVPCARLLGGSTFAPNWLREDLAQLDGDSL